MQYRSKWVLLYVQPGSVGDLKILIQRDITSHGCRHWFSTPFAIAAAASLAACSSIADPRSMHKQAPRIYLPQL